MQCRARRWGARRCGVAGVVHVVVSGLPDAAHTTPIGRTMLSLVALHQRHHGLLLIHPAVPFGVQVPSSGGGGGGVWGGDVTGVQPRRGKEGQEGEDGGERGEGRSVGSAAAG